MSSIQETQNQIVEEINIFDDWMDKYNYIIELAKDLPLIDAQHKTNQYLIDGCQSKVWINADLVDEKVHYTADSDAIITKGIIALLIRVMNDRTPSELVDIDLFFLEEIGLKENLSPNRANGLVAMIKQMKLYALAFKTKLGQ
ncbi:MAG: SufE family protein [Bacteroidales bacterium]|nr:SufE family protein [Bacteroidales bacterium]